MLFSGEDLGRTLVDALGVLTARETPVIEEEAQQIEIARPQLLAQEEVVAQSAVEILDDGTGSCGGVGKLGDSGLERLEERSESLAQSMFLLPVECLIHR